MMKNIAIDILMMHISEAESQLRMYIIKILYNQIENDIIMGDFNNGKKIGLDSKRIES